MWRINLDNIDQGWENIDQVFTLQYPCSCIVLVYVLSCLKSANASINQDNRGVIFESTERGYSSTLL